VVAEAAAAEREPTVGNRAQDVSVSIRRTIAEILALPDPGRHVAGKARSGKWPRVRHAHLAKHPGCAVCGNVGDCDAHHVYPYHLFPELELDPENLITLCRGHHLFFGHLGEFSAFNPLVREHAGIARFCLRARSAIMRMARAEAKKMKGRKS
jgi:hypothetical protein